MFILFDKDYIVKNISDTPVDVDGLQSLKINDIEQQYLENLIGNKLPKNIIEENNLITHKKDSDIKVAIICNWKDKCGISTYSEYLHKELSKKVKETKIFSEITTDKTGEDENFVDRCWKRGEDISDLSKKVLEWNPDFIIIQHEYGIFPNAFRFMQLMQNFQHIPYAVVMHSVYKHLDKVVYSECAKNIIVHSNNAKKTLIECRKYE